MDICETKGDELSHDFLGFARALTEAVNLEPFEVAGVCMYVVIAWWLAATSRRALAPSYYSASTD